MSVTSHYYTTLHNLEAEHLLDVSSQGFKLGHVASKPLTCFKAINCFFFLSDIEDLFSVHQTFLPQLNTDLQAFVEGWNNHPIRTEGNKTPVQLWYLGMMSNPINQPESLQVKIQNYRNN